MTARFTLHPQMAADTTYVCDLKLCLVLLMDDARFPWVILVPRRAGAAEFHDLDETDRVCFAGEIARASRIVKFWAEQGSGCDKLNIAMIGNIVPQLHAHIVARTRNDPAWPYPVWGRGEPQRHTAGSLNAAITELASLFRDNLAN